MKTYAADSPTPPVSPFLDHLFPPECRSLRRVACAEVDSVSRPGDSRIYYISTFLQRSFFAGILPGLAALVLTVRASAAPPVFTSLKNATTVSWTNSFTNATATVEFNTSLPTGTWLCVKNTFTTSTVSRAEIVPPSASGFYRLLTADITDIPPGMALVPSGWFMMSAPVHTQRRVYVSQFLIDQHETTRGEWTRVRDWALTNGYSITGGTGGALTNYPTGSVVWYACLAWCNARSEMEGRIPAYYTSATQTNVLRTDAYFDISAACVKWDAGYRLPTEAEWEKAARGALYSNIYPWGDVFSTNLANAANSVKSLTPVGSYPANDYSLYDMAGNVAEFCWDRYEEGSPPVDGSINPRGPPVSSFANSYIVMRGGYYSAPSDWTQCGWRGLNPDLMASSAGGSRTVLPSE